jgi:hypothetical protein
MDYRFEQDNNNIQNGFSHTVIAISNQDLYLDNVCKKIIQPMAWLN